MVRRDIYMNQLIKYKDSKLIKVITGLRRCGKSTLLKMFEQDLMLSGVPHERITNINFELMIYDDIRDYRDFYSLLRGQIKSGAKYYLILDEVQQVAGWEKAVNSLTVESDIDVDVYVTGSNAHMLSSDISTLLSGRYVEIKMLPLSFKEFLLFEHLPTSWTTDEKFQQYLKYGSLPVVTTLPQDDLTINELLLGIYNTVVIKDIVARSNCKNVDLLERLMRYVIACTGNIVSPNKISGFLNSQSKGENVKSSTIATYLDILEKAFIVYQAPRYDIKGKEQLRTLSKYYVADTGIRNALMGYHGSDIGHVLETIVYFELRRRGYNVFIGKWYDSEVDLLAIRQDVRKYYQVTLSLMDEKVRSREFAPLVAIADNYEKMVITMDKTYLTNYEGIRFLNIIDFLLEND